MTIFEPQLQDEVSKAMTVARIAMSTTLMPVNVGTFQTRRHIGPKVTTVTRKAAFRRQDDDSYEDGDPEGPRPCDC